MKKRDIPILWQWLKILVVNNYDSQANSKLLLNIVKYDEAFPVTTYELIKSEHRLYSSGFLSMQNGSELYFHILKAV